MQLFWPDDNKWYDAEILDFNQRNKAAKYVRIRKNRAIIILQYSINVSYTYFSTRIYFDFISFFPSFPLVAD